MDKPYFSFAGQDSRDYGIWITSKKVYGGGAADVTQQSISGRNGDLLIPNKRRKNHSVSYGIYLRTPGGYTLSEASMRVRCWLYRSTQYQKLFDSYQPEFYRWAAYLEEFALEDSGIRDATGTLTFTAKPGLHYVTGDWPVSGTGTIRLINPSPEPALPVIRIPAVSGVTTILVQNDVGSFSYPFGAEGESYTDVVVNCETMKLYEDKPVPTNLFGVCGFPLEFPSLAEGVNTLFLVGSDLQPKNIAFTVEPRWVAP